MRIDDRPVKLDFQELLSLDLDSLIASPHGSEAPVPLPGAVPSAGMRPQQVSCRTYSMSAAVTGTDRSWPSRVNALAPECRAGPSAPASKTRVRCELRREL